MIVARWTFNVRFGRLNEAAALLKETLDRDERTVRVYKFVLGSRDTISMEIEYESMADFERIVAEWAASSEESATFREKAGELMERGGTCDIWELV